MLKASENPQLAGLTKPILEKFIEPPPQGKSGHYVPHFVIEQILLATVGPFDWELVEILRGHVPRWESRDGKKQAGPFDNAIVGVVYRLSCEVDGRRVVLEEAGSCDAAAYEDNDAERYKKASSDALKRCAMRLGVGIHLWCKKPEQYIVHAALLYADREDDSEHVAVEAVVGVEEADAEE